METSNNPMSAIGIIQSQNYYLVSHNSIFDPHSMLNYYSAEQTVNKLT